MTTAPPIASTGRIRTPDARADHAIRPGGLEEVLAVASSAGTVIFLMCAWVLLQLLVLGGLAEARSQHLLYNQYRSELAAATAPTGELDYNNNPIAPGSPVALLTIPQLGIEQVVVDGTEPGDLLAGPGHLRDSPMPGQQGYSVVMGRGATYGAPFGENLLQLVGIDRFPHEISRLSKGDTIQVRNAEAKVTYTVVDVRRAGDRIPPLTAGANGRLVLVSSEDRNLLSGLRPQSAVYVDADTAKATPAGPTGGVLPAAEEPMGRDTSGLPTLVLLLALVVGLAAAVSWAQQRFRGVLVWLVAAPVAIALAWALTDQVMRLLPNLM